MVCSELRPCQGSAIFATKSLVTGCNSDESLAISLKDYRLSFSSEFKVKVCIFQLKFVRYFDENEDVKIFRFRKGEKVSGCDEGTNSTSKSIRQGHSVERNGLIIIYV